jgi:hypothetical protein
LTINNNIMTKKFYAQKDALGFPIVGTMMSGALVPNQKNLIEIKSGMALGSHPQKFKYYVRKDKAGKILPNSLFTSYAKQSSASTIDLHTAALGANCIQFVANTTSGGNTFYLYIEVSSDITYTATWGDGTNSEGSVNGDNTIQHNFPSQDTAYTVQLCFSDATKVTMLEFWGND